MEIRNYSESDQELGPIITEPNLLICQVAGEASTVDEFIYNLTRLWSIRPCSTYFWSTVDGKQPQKGEPAKVTLALKLQSMDLLEEGNPKLGLKSNACSGQNAQKPV